MSGTHNVRNGLVPAAKVAAAGSTVLWILGFVLCFVIPAGSRYIWVPDALLLLGFCPFLWFFRPGWPWIIFGLLNMSVGFILELMIFIPDVTFTQEMKLVRKHLAEQHSAITWIIIGFISVLLGVVRTVCDIANLVWKIIYKNRKRT